MVLEMSQFPRVAPTVSCLVGIKTVESDSHSIPFPFTKLRMVISVLIFEKTHQITSIIKNPVSMFGKETAMLHN